MSKGAHAMLHWSLCLSGVLSLSLLNVIRLGLCYNSVNAKQITQRPCAHTLFLWLKQKFKLALF